ncbi:ABC transporter permease [Microbacterium arborescens]|uniref:ABC transporter permease n=1 Tax=Microbacterium arborescens TaxID=33883 RepID=UPI0027D90C82|nr:ABC transporter permease [Microbacterium arborescens]
MAAIDARILRRDPAPILVMVVIPLLFVPFLLPGATAQLAATGHAGAPGAQYAVPGLAVLFAMLCVQQIVVAFHRDVQSGTWERLRMSPASLSSLLMGKAIAAFVAQVLQLGVVLGGGAVLFGYRPTGSWVGIIVVGLAFSLVVVAFGVLVVATFTTQDQALAACSVVAMLMAGLGGAFGPVAALPEVLRVVAPISPAYWTLDALSALSLDGAGLSEVIVPTVVLIGFAVVFAGGAWLAFARRGRWS